MSVYRVTYYWKCGAVAGIGYIEAPDILEASRKADEARTNPEWRYILEKK